MFTQIQDRWDSWAGTLDARRRIKNWRRLYPQFSAWSVVDLRSPRLFRKKILTADSQIRMVDGMQSCLLALAQQGDQEAALTLTMQLLPGLKKLARTSGSTYTSASSEVLSTFYEVFFAHNLDRRPRKIAANLLLDTKQKLVRRYWKHSRSCEAAEKHAKVQKKVSGTCTLDVDRMLLVRAIGETISHSHRGSHKKRAGHIAYDFWILGKSSKIIAAELGIKQTAVTTCLWRLRKQLLQTLEVSAAPVVAA